MNRYQLHQLLHYLDANLKSCDHTTKLTTIFVHIEQLEREKVLPWLADHGGYCDCEVLHNLADLDESLQALQPVPPVRTRPEKKRLPRQLRTAAGWDFSNLPEPWRVANPYDCDDPLQLKLGKKGGCTFTLVERSMPSGDQTSDDYWSGLWYARTELPEKGQLRITHGALDLPDDFGSTLVRSPSWIPVYCWIVPKPDSWHVEVKTELDRYEGDLPQISSLISRLAMGKTNNSE